MICMQQVILQCYTVLLNNAVKNMVYFIMLHLNKTQCSIAYTVEYSIQVFVEYCTNNVLNSSTSHYIAQYYIILFCTISLYAKLHSLLLIPCYQRIMFLAVGAGTSAC